MEWYEIVISILTGIATAIPLIVKLVQYVQKAVKEKNWNSIISMVIEYMKTAETMFSTGAERKSWVIEMLKTSAKVSNFDLTEENLSKVGVLIDKMCDLSKKINIPK